MTERYAATTHEDEERILKDILSETTIETLMAIPGVAELVKEDYQNDILRRWENERTEDDEEDE